jgi:nitroreductase
LSEVAGAAARPVALDVDEALATTRTVRRRLDLSRPVPGELVEECLELALQAPSGSNRQGWHFVTVTDAERREALADLYRRAYVRYEERTYASAPAGWQGSSLLDSARYLADHLAEVPLLLVPCLWGRPEGLPLPALAAFFGSIMPATWSFCLAARARGLASALTTMHLAFEEEAAAILEIPVDKVTQAALVPVAFLLGDAPGRGARRPLAEVLHREHW